MSANVIYLVTAVGSFALIVIGALLSPDSETLSSILIGCGCSGLTAAMCAFFIERQKTESERLVIQEERSLIMRDI